MSKKSPPHPMQPLVVVGDRVHFKVNKIVRYLLDKGGIDLNDIVTAPFDQDELDHFYQLIGYSVAGYHELSPCGGNEVISEASATAAAHALCEQFGTKYCHCLDEEGCPVHSKTR